MVDPLVNTTVLLTLRDLKMRSFMFIYADLEENGDNLMLPLPQEVLNSLNLDIGDTVIFSLNEDGSFTLVKKDATK